MKLTAGTSLLLAAGMAVFGSAIQVSKIVTEAFPVFVASAARMLLAAVFLGSVLFVTGRLEGLLSGISRPDRVRLGAIALTGMFGFSVLMLCGMKEIPGAIGGIVASYTLLGKRLTANLSPLAISAIAAALSGPEK